MTTSKKIKITSSLGLQSIPPEPTTFLIPFISQNPSPHIIEGKPGLPTPSGSPYNDHILISSKRGKIEGVE